jgi:hypothetical protein
MRFGAIAILIIVLAAATQVNADCIKNQYGNVVCGKGKCETDQYGKVLCSQRDGGIMQDRYGNILCGIGACAKDYLGQIWCSKEPGGGAAIDSNGKVKCLGGCEAGNSKHCEEAR